MMTFAPSTRYEVSFHDICGFLSALSAFLMCSFIVPFLQSSEATGTTRDALCTMFGAAASMSATTSTFILVAEQLNFFIVEVPSSQSLLSFESDRLRGSAICAAAEEAKTADTATAVRIDLIVVL